MTAHSEPAPRACMRQLALSGPVDRAALYVCQSGAEVTVPAPLPWQPAPRANLRRSPDLNTHAPVPLALPWPPLRWSATS